MPLSLRALSLAASIAATLAMITPVRAAETAGIDRAAGREASVLGVDIKGVARPGLTMTQLTPYRVYQRSTMAGGAGGKGSGAISIPIRLQAAAALIECRLRDALAPGAPVLRDWVLAAADVPASASSAACPEVPADQKQYFVDLRADGDDAAVQLGTSPVMMGRVIVHWGQSQANQFVTAAGTPPVRAPASSAVLRHGKWSAIPSNSLGLNPFLYMEGLAHGVAVGIVATAVDNSVVASWLPATGTNFPALAAAVDMAGGFEAMDTYIGGSDLGVGTAPDAFAAMKRTVIRDLQDRHNPLHGRNTELVLSATTVRRANDRNHAGPVEAQQAAERKLAAELGGAYYEGWDIAMMAGDSVHHDATGNPAYGFGLSRAFTALRSRGVIAAGPTIRAATMSGAAITLAVDMPPDSGSLVLTGNPAARFTAYPAGTTTTPLQIASVQAGRNNIVLTLAAAPKGDVDIWLHRYPDPGPALAADVIRDSYTADGAPYGRLVEPTVGAPVTADNPVQAVVAAVAVPSEKLIARP